MASWRSNSGQTQGNTQLPGFAGFNKSPFTFFDNSSSSSGFGSDSSLTASNSAFPTANTGSGFASELFGRQTANSATTSAFATQLKSPFSTNPTGGDPIPFENSISAFHQTSNSVPIFQQTSNPFLTLQPSKFSSSAGSSQFVGHPTGGSPFSSVNSTSLFGQTINSPTTSPFGTRPFGSQFSSTISSFGTKLPSMISSSQSPVTSFGTTSTINSGFGTSKTSSTGSSIINTNSRILVQANTSANNGSVFVPFPRSDIGISSIQGTKLQSYATTPEGSYATYPVDKVDDVIFSISAMPFYKSKSHEELRLEDYQLTGKTGTKSSSGFAVNINTSTSTSPSLFLNASSSSTATQATTSAPNSGTASPFRSASATESIITSIPEPVSTDNIHKLRLEDYQSTGKTCGCATVTNSASSSSVINISISVSPSPISSSSSSSTGTPGLCFVNPPSSDSQCLGFSVPSSCTSYMPTPFLPVSHPVLLIPLSISTGHLGNLFFTTQTAISSPASGTVSAFSNSPTTESIITGIPEPVSTGGFIPRFGSSTENKQQPISQWPVSVGQSFVTNPIATEATATLPKTVQYESSCLPVSDYAEPVKRFPPLMNVTFNGELPGVYKRSAAPILRENLRSWAVFPNEEQKLEKSLRNLSVSDNSTNMCERGGTQSENSQVKEARCVPNMKLSKDIKHDDDHSEKESMPANILKGQDHEDSYITSHYADVIAMIPKLTCPEYYMEPSMDDLAANEMKMPGFCRQVKDFVIGRRDYGSIKFLGETDVRNLDLESIVQFNIRDVIVCMDGKAKLPVWQGVYKAAEITLLNVKCIDKNTRKEYIDGPKVDAYKQLLVRKTVEQGAEFVSFNPVKGEWRFKVEF